MRNFYERRRVSSDMKEKQQRYEALVHAFHADIFRYAFYLIQDKSIAEDVVQETFLRAWRSLDALKNEKANCQKKEEGIKYLLNQKIKTKRFNNLRQSNRKNETQ